MRYKFLEWLHHVGIGPGMILLCQVWCQSSAVCLWLISNTTTESVCFIYILIIVSTQSVTVQSYFILNCKSTLSMGEGQGEVTHFLIQYAVVGSLNPEYGGRGSNSVLKVKIRIYWSELNSSLYFYIVLTNWLVWT